MVFEFVSYLFLILVPLLILSCLLQSMTLSRPISSAFSPTQLAYFWNFSLAPRKKWGLCGIGRTAFIFCVYFTSSPNLVVALWLRPMLRAWWVLLSMISVLWYTFLAPGLSPRAVDIIPPWPYSSFTFVVFAIDTPLVGHSVPLTCPW